MSWVKLDDGFPGHPKVDRLLENDESAGLAAVGLFVLALCRAGHQLTDGILSDRAIRTLAPVGSDDLINRLLEVGLLERDEDGWMIHDYLEWNPSRETVLARRKTESDRKAVAREKAAEARRIRDAQRLSEQESQRDSQADGASTSEPPSALPGPSRPGPSVKNPPNPPQAGGTTNPVLPVRPSGNRKRDLDEYESAVSVWAGWAFPGMEEPQRSQMVRGALGRGCTTEVEVREFVVRWGSVGVLGESGSEAA